MDLKPYETVFILTPVLSDEQMKDTVQKFKAIITDQGGTIVHQEDWGLKKLAYPIEKKSNGYYTVLEFRAKPEFVKTLETEYRRDERVIRHLVVALDKHAVIYNEKRRQKRMAESEATPNQES
ncbi:MAG: 30S ribosomal protein S6 [Microscillaceae bacterium]|nr:30S ribosomal protein S6 [Microscillaceae bacterium]